MRIGQLLVYQDQSETIGNWNARAFYLIFYKNNNKELDCQLIVNVF